MSRIRKTEKRRRVALIVCATLPKDDAALMLDMLGLIPVEAPKHTGSPLFDAQHRSPAGAA